jgi:TonB family protein
MNETPVQESLVDEASVQSRTKREKSLSNRILAYAFLASVALNIGWVALVSRSTFFGKGTSPLMLHEKPIKVFKPILVKPQPKPVKPPPPPPKLPKKQPKIKPIVQHIRSHPMPRPATHPMPPKPVTHSMPPKPVTHSMPPKPVTHQVQMTKTKNPIAPGKIPIKSQPPAKTGVIVDNGKPADNGPAASTGKTTGTGTTIDLGKPADTDGSKQAGDNKGTETEPAKKDTPKGDDKQEILHPSKWVPIDTQEASLPDGIGDDVSMDGIEPGSTTNDKIVISFTIDETGHIRNARIQESSGNHDLDNRFLEAVRRAHGRAAIQDHIPHDQPGTKTFSISTG